MRVYIQSKTTSRTGKGFFFHRLSAALKEMGVEVVSSPDVKHDVSLHAVKIKQATRSKRVVRLDGIYHNLGMNYKSMNKSIKQHMGKAHALIYQSIYGKAMCVKYLGKFRGPTATILNGADPRYYDRIQPASVDCDHLYLAVSRWRPHKRLRDIIESFLLASIDSSKMYVAGNLKDSGLKKQEILKYTSTRRVKFLNVRDQKELASYYRAAKALVHLCWFDCCPNSVAEAICAGCPVITNNVGGTRELVKPSGGFVCKIDRPYNMKPVQLYRPPKINRGIIADAITVCSRKEIPVDNSHLDIRTIAAQYKEFFEKL